MESLCSVFGVVTNSVLTVNVYQANFRYELLFSYITLKKGWHDYRFHDSSNFHLFCWIMQARVLKVISYYTLYLAFEMLTSTVFHHNPVTFSGFVANTLS